MQLQPLKINLHFFKIFSIYLCLIFPLSSHADLPDLGDPTQKELSPFEEYVMGRNFYKAVKASVPFIEDLAVNDYITNLGQKLVSQSDQPDKLFNFFILKINSINAFAGPDAQIGIHSGLFLAANNESQLAGVLAHEVSHVTQRHLARAITESNSSPAAIFATVLAGILLSTQNPQAGAAVLYGGTAALMQSQINFTRHNEYEADRIGITVLRDAGINPDGMAEFFETLLNKADSNNVLARMEYLRTHPLNSARVAEAKHRINTADKKLPNDSLNFQLSKARIIVNTAASLQDLIKRLDTLKKNDRNITTDYTHAIALIAYEKPLPAIKKLKKLIKKSNHPWFQLALAKAYENNKQFKKSYKVLNQLHKLYPNYLPVTIEYTNRLNHQKRYEDAIHLLKRQLQQKKLSIIYQTLAQSYYSNGQITSALEATSHQYEMDGYLKLAAQQISNALKQPGLKPSTKRRLESRKKDLGYTLRKEKQK
jgi:beta-barrel assembly-enhancing protease